MTTNQRCESMNAYLKHFLQRTLKLYEFVEQIERALARVRYTESHDDYDSIHSSLVLSTHLKALEKHASSLVFNKVRDQIIQEKFLSISLTRTNGNLSFYTLSSYIHEDKQWHATYDCENSSMTCSCMCFESIGLPCAHLFAVMKFEKIRTTPQSLILSRWRKDAKSNCDDCTRQQESQTQGNSSMSSYGALISLTQKVSYYACSSKSAYNVALNELTKLASRVENIILAGNDIPIQISPTNNRIPSVLDPEVVHTKGADKATNKKPRRPHRCKNCHGTGHNSQTCRQPTRSPKRCKKTPHR